MLVPSHTITFALTIVPVETSPDLLCPLVGLMTRALPLWIKYWMDGRSYHWEHRPAFKLCSAVIIGVLMFGRYGRSWNPSFKSA